MLIPPKRLKLDTLSIVHYFVMRSFIVGITNCPTSGRGHGHLKFSNFGK